jgi:hypothetical protein
MVMEHKPALESRLEQIVRDAQLYKQKHKHKKKRFKFTMVSLCLSSAMFAACTFVSPHMISEASVFKHTYAVNNCNPSALIASTPRSVEQIYPKLQQQKAKKKHIIPANKDVKQNEMTSQKQTHPSKQQENLSPKPSEKQPVAPVQPSIEPTIPEWIPTQWYRKGDVVAYNGKYYKAKIRNKNFPPEKPFFFSDGLWEEVMY